MIFPAVAQGLSFRSPEFALVELPRMRQKPHTGGTEELGSCDPLLCSAVLVLLIDLGVGRGDSLPCWPASRSRVIRPVRPEDYKQVTLWTVPCPAGVRRVARGTGARTRQDPTSKATLDAYQPITDYDTDVRSSSK